MEVTVTTKMYFLSKMIMRQSGDKADSSIKLFVIKMIENNSWTASLKKVVLFFYCAIAVV